MFWLCQCCFEFFFNDVPRVYPLTCQNKNFHIFTCLRQHFLSLSRSCHQNKTFSSQASANDSCRRRVKAVDVESPALSYVTRSDGGAPSQVSHDLLLRDEVLRFAAPLVGMHCWCCVAHAHFRPSPIRSSFFFREKLKS